MNDTHTHFINGEWFNGDGPAFTSLNPATLDTLWTGKEANEPLVNSSVIAARDAFEEWGLLRIEDRIPYLKTYQNILTNECKTLATTISKETGKPLWDSLNEVSSMICKIDISIEAYSDRCKSLKKEQSAGISVTRHKPHGVMAVLGPFNFPGHLPNGHIIPALLAGNSVVFKPSEITPLIGELMTEYWERCKLPKGVINLIQGGKKTGELLIKHEGIDGILFTGSFAVGKKIAETLIETPFKILALEMGGNNPLIIGKTKDLKSAAYQAALSAFLSSGQRCTCARRLIILESVFKEFIENLISITKSIQIGVYTNTPEPFMGPVINPAAAKYLLQRQEDLIKKGGASLSELKLLPQGVSFLSPGILDMTKASDLRDEEYFGPLLQVFKAKTLDDAIFLANQTKYGLTAGIFCDDSQDYQHFYKKIRAGIVNWNTPLTGASSFAPFGGLGKSGNHRPSAYYAADYCAYPVASTESDEIHISKLPGIHVP